jgi:hypothetical protein
LISLNRGQQNQKIRSACRKSCSREIKPFNGIKKCE